MRKSTIFAFAAAMVASAGIFSASAQKDVKYILNPAAGETTDLMSVELLFPENTVLFYENSRMPVATLVNNTTGAEYYCQDADRNAKAEAMTGYNLVFIGVDNEEAIAINEPGDYTLTIRGMYTPGNNENDDLDGAEDVNPISADYTIYYPVKYLLSPAAGENVTNLSEISIDFTENNNVVFFENNRMPAVTLVNNTTGSEYTCDEPVRNTFAQTDGIAYTFKFVDADGDEAIVTEVGNYTLTIKALGLQGEAEEGETAEIEALPAITVAYEIAFPVEYVLTPDPKSNDVLDLMTVTLEFPNNRNVAFYENNQMPVAVLENLTTGAVYTAQEADRNASAMTEGVEYSFTFIEEDYEDAAAITAPGQYKLTVRAMGLEDENGELEALPVLYANYTIEYPVEYVIYPFGNVASNLKTVSIEFPNNKNVEFDNNSRFPLAVIENLENGKEYTAESADREAYAETDGIVWSFTFADEDGDVVDIVEPGAYLLTIRGAMIVNEDEMESVALPFITKGYTIPYPVEYTLDPAAGSEVENIEAITLQFPYNKVQFVENTQTPVVVLHNDDTDVDYAGEANLNTRALTEGCEYIITFVDEDGEMVTVTEPGNYSLTIRYMMVSETTFEYDEDGNITNEDNPEITTYELPNIYASYVIGYPVEYLLNPTDGDQVDNLQGITLEFPYTKNVMFYENNRMPVATLVNTVTEVEYTCAHADQVTFAESEGTVFKFMFTEEGEEDPAEVIAEDGVYTLTIKALMLIDGQNAVISDLPVITATYYIAGSGAKAAELVEGDVYNVYTINGVKVISNGTASDLNALGAGLYIINGKKVLVTK